ncbi:hypothetical protein BASA83_002261 [Batrachochytrium salamandrivorans]|nr:hypothetical protein BASA83_002261 [Batrachochytrium salamandrivorans]
MFSESDASDCTLASDAPSSLSLEELLWTYPMFRLGINPWRNLLYYLAHSVRSVQELPILLPRSVARGSVREFSTSWLLLDRLLPHLDPIPPWSDSYPNAATVVVATAPTHSLSPSPPCPELQFSSPTSLAATISP